MNKELWEKAIEYHGHKCAGLALGFRMGEEAKKIFGTDALIHCRIPSKSCITDGITGSTGASEANGRILIDSSIKDYIFYVPEDEEGWSFSFKTKDFPGQDPIETIFGCGRDFLFHLLPCDIE